LLLPTRGLGLPTYNSEVPGFPSLWL